MSAISSSGVIASIDELIGLRHEARLLDTGKTPGTRSILAGSHVSRFRGRGMDFSESRLYEPGDDIRNIDWRVTARTGEPHTKVFIEERERPVFIVIDFSPSLYFGTRVAFKSVIASKIATLIAWSTVQHGDRIGSILRTPNHTFDLKPKAGRKGVLSLINMLSQATVIPDDLTGKSLMNDTLEHASRAINPGSLVFIISDFYHLDESSERHLNRIRKHNDLVGCQIVDPIETTAPPPGHYAITDGQSISNINTRPNQYRADYARIHEQRTENMTALFHKLNAKLLSIHTDQNVPNSLRDQLSGRYRNIRRSA